MDNEKKEQVESLLSPHYADKSRTMITHYYPDYRSRINWFKENNIKLRFYKEINCKIVQSGTHEGLPVEKAVLQDKTTFQKNLVMIDAHMDLLYAEMVRYAFFYGTLKLTDVVSILDKEDPLNLSPTRKYPIYAKKIQDLLVAMALSMKAGTLWNGREGTNGRFSIVKNTREATYCRIFDCDDFRAFLLNNTAFDFPSCNRYHMTEVYEQKSEDSDETAYFTQLNAQIRMLRTKSREFSKDRSSQNHTRSSSFVSEAKIVRWVHPQVRIDCSMCDIQDPAPAISANIVY